jgi:hypothetical protein
MGYRTLIAVFFVSFLVFGCVGCIDNKEVIEDGSQGKPLISEDTILDIVILDGLEIGGFDQRTFEDTELIIRGDIVIQDDAVLSISNSKIIVDQEYNKQYMLSVKDNASFFIDNVFFKSLEWRWFNFEYSDNAMIRFIDFENEQAPWQSVEGNVTIKLVRSSAGITIFSQDIFEGEDPFGGSIVIDGSDSVYFEIDLKPGREYVFEFPNGFVEEWHPDYFLGTVDVFNSTITNLDIDIWPGVDVTVVNSSHFELGWIFGDGWGQKHSVGKSGEIVGLKEGWYDDVVFAANNASLRLVNTTFTGWWPIVTGDFELTVRDCWMIDPWAYNEARFRVFDSFIFYMSATNEAVVEIVNSTVEDSLVALESASISIFNSDFDGDTIFDVDARIVIDGVEIK